MIVKFDLRRMITDNTLATSKLLHSYAQGRNYLEFSNIIKLSLIFLKIFQNIYSWPLQTSQILDFYP